MVSEREGTFPGLGRFPAPCRGSEATILEAAAPGARRAEAQPALPGAGRRRTGPGAAERGSPPGLSAAPRCSVPPFRPLPPARMASPWSGRMPQPRRFGQLPAQRHREPVASTPKLTPGMRQSRSGGGGRTNAAALPTRGDTTDPRRFLSINRAPRGRGGG